MNEKSRRKSGETRRGSESEEEGEILLGAVGWREEIDQYWYSKGRERSSERTYSLPIELASESRVDDVLCSKRES